MTKDELTGVIRRRYDRQARLYDLKNAVMGHGAFADWRRRLWAQVDGQPILELGVGTGANFPF